MIYKRGSIVPRFLAKATRRKAQHCLTFGCDVRVDGRTVTATSDGPVFLLSTLSHRMPNGTRARSAVSFKDVTVHGRRDPIWWFK